ncbi:MAG: hypothetical protein QXE31_01880 [Candidatus Woesearchaeota archaeon]
MAYDSSLDKVLFSESFEIGNSRISVSVYSYNNASPKLQISRENNENNEWKFTKLGRLTKEETEKIMPIMEKALSYM